MKFLHLFVSFSIALSPVMAAEPGKLQNGDTVAICGDSITEQKAYSRFIEDYLLMCQPAADLTVVQFGWSGEKAPGFLARMKNDVLPFKPAVVTTLYGMNDGAYTFSKPETIDAYRKAMMEIVKTFRDSGVREIIVGSPPVVDSTTFKRIAPEVYNQTLADLAGVDREISASENTVFADVNSTMAAVMPKAKARYGSEYHIAGADGVHPAFNGHLIIATAFLKAMGCNGDIGKLTLDMASGKGEATTGHRVLNSTSNTLEIESTRYPFCFSGDPANPAATSGIIEFLPFNEELNRFILTVQNPPAAKLRVTWGDKSREYPAEALKQGINLAADFPDNPFSKPFQDVDTKVQEKQVFETLAVKSSLSSLPNWKKALPEKTPELDQLGQAVVEKVRANSAAIRSAVVPVKHVIKIEPAS